MLDGAQTFFEKLNHGWNADPNSPMPRVSVGEGFVEVRFWLNPFLNDEADKGKVGVLRFEKCSKFRMGFINDEGWYRGQCRFSRLAPAWGEFYQITGDSKADECLTNWTDIEGKDGNNHYLFYFRDEEFECFASNWTLERTQPPNS